MAVVGALCLLLLLSAGDASPVPRSSFDAAGYISIARKHSQTAQRPEIADEQRRPVAIPAPRSSVVSGARVTAPCVRIERNVALYCGRARARLSVFPEAVFRNGSCARRKLDGVRLLQVRLGARALDGSQTNNGLPYFSLGSAESASRPRSANVVAFFRSRRWFGRVASMKADEDGGTFVAQAIAGSHGHASGRFSC